MNFLTLLVIVFAAVYCVPIVIVKGRCSQDPHDISMSSGRLGVLATSDNIKVLTKLMKQGNIKKAYAYGWNDKIAPMVVSDSGSVTEYVPGKNTCRHALLVGKCTCPADNVIVTDDTSCKQGVDSNDVERQEYDQIQPIDILSYDMNVCDNEMYPGTLALHNKHGVDIKDPKQESQDSNAFVTTEGYDKPSVMSSNALQNYKMDAVAYVENKQEDQATINNTSQSK